MTICMIARHILLILPCIFGRDCCVVVCVEVVHYGGKITEKVNVKFVPSLVVQFAIIFTLFCSCHIYLYYVSRGRTPNFFFFEENSSCASNDKVPSKDFCCCFFSQSITQLDLPR